MSPILRITIQRSSACRVRWAIRVLAWLAFFVASYLAGMPLTEQPSPDAPSAAKPAATMVLRAVGRSGSPCPCPWPDWPATRRSPVSACSSVLRVRTKPLDRYAGHHARRSSQQAQVSGSSDFKCSRFGHFCPYCIFVDLCGIALGGLALWSADSRSLRNEDDAGCRPGFDGAAFYNACRRASRAASGRAYDVHDRRSESPLAARPRCLAVLIGGQVIWPSPTHRRETVALDQPINMTNAKSDATTATARFVADAETHVAMRIPTESRARRADESSNEPNQPDLT